MIQFDFITQNSNLIHVTLLCNGVHYMFDEGVALKFMGWREGGKTEWSQLGPRTADWLRRSLLISDIEAGHYD